MYIFIDFCSNLENKIQQRGNRLTIMTEKIKSLQDDLKRSESLFNNTFQKHNHQIPLRDDLQPYKVGVGIFIIVKQ